MDDLYKRIEALCSQKGITITGMCKESGANRASLTDLKKGRKQGLSAETLAKIATYFKVSVDFLLGVETKKAPTSESGREIDDRKMKAAFLGRIFLTAARVCGIIAKNKKSEIAIKNSALQLQIADEIADETRPHF